MKSHLGIPENASTTCTEHGHDWQIVPGWGVLIGASRCKLCGKVARQTDFPHIKWDEGTEHEPADD